MSDSDLKQTLLDKGLLKPQEPGVSRAVAFLSGGDVGISEGSEISLPDNSTHALKEINEVYTEAKSAASDNEITSLCMAIEYAIAYYDHSNDHGLRDDVTIRMLEKLSMKPEMPLTGVGALVQAYLRLELSLEDYSRADVRQAVRKIQRSAQRHSKDGPRGYLDFIHHFMH